MSHPSRTRAWVPMFVASTLVFLGLLGPTLPALDPLPVATGAPQRVVVPKSIVHVDDGDSIDVHWPGKEIEHVRILGIDTPEVLHLDHEIPYAQPFGEEAGGFMKGCLAVAGKVELLRSGKRDKYGRTLAYVFLDGKNYSPLVIAARLAYGPNPKFGDNGLPEPYAACMAAEKKAGPPPFEPPWQYRRRMRDVAKWMKDHGVYPRGP